MTEKKATTTTKKPRNTHGGARAGAGRKTEYKPEYCQVAIDTLKDGHSLTGLAGKLGVTKLTVLNWRKAYPDFNEACSVGTAAAVAWWEEQAREAAQTGKGNAAVIIFGLKNRARDDWRDRIDHTHTGANDGPIQQEVTHSIEPSDAYMRMIKGGGNGGA